MNYDSFDSSGTDDDLPIPVAQSHNRVIARGGRISLNGRPNANDDMEGQIHQIEKEAYIAVLRAFKAQADAITWEKESLITELRKELRVSNEEHRELLNRVNGDDTIRRIREWRQSGGMLQQPSSIMRSSQLVHDTIPSPSVSGSMKKHKPNINQPIPFHPQPQAVEPSHHQFPSSVANRGNVPIVKTKKHKPVAFPGSSSAKPALYHPPEQQLPRGLVVNRLPSAVVPAEPTNGTIDPESFVGRRVRTKWPEDNTFYEAKITKYDPVAGRHALVYDIGTLRETWEWVTLSEISSGDIEWVDENPMLGLNKATAVVANNGQQRGSGLLKSSVRKSQNGSGKRKHSEIRIRPTNVVIREVERVIGSHNPQEVEKAKRVLEEQENALVDAITKLGDVSDGENEGGFRRN